ncbi:MAG TPA: hypothetical protein VF714_00915 [Jatrophihabitans sp.]|jgi:hypothetical protein
MIPPFTPSADVERRASGWAVISYSRLPTGMNRVNGFLLTLPADCDDLALGSAIIEALDRSREIPDESSLPTKRLHELLGFRSASAYMKGTESLTVFRRSPTTAEIDDLDHRGTWFAVPRPRRITAAPADDAEALGRAVRSVFDAKTGS